MGCGWADKYSATSTWKMLLSIVSIEHRNQIRVDTSEGTYLSRA